MFDHAGTAHITVRPAFDRDAAEISRIAALDSARPLQGHALVAEEDGRTVAAIAVADGRLVADPFVRTRAAVELLRTRARQLATAQSKRRETAVLQTPATSAA